MRESCMFWRYLLGLYELTTIQKIITKEQQITLYKKNIDNNMNERDK